MPSHDKQNIFSLSLSTRKLKKNTIITFENVFLIFLVLCVLVLYLYECLCRGFRTPVTGITD